MPLRNFLVDGADHNDGDTQCSQLRQCSHEQRRAAQCFGNTDECQKSSRFAGEFFDTVNKEDDGDGQAQCEDADVSVGEECEDHGKMGEEQRPILPFPFHQTTCRLNAHVDPEPHLALFRGLHRNVHGSFTVLHASKRMEKAAKDD